MVATGVTAPHRLDVTTTKHVIQLQSSVWRQKVGKWKVEARIICEENDLPISEAAATPKGKKRGASTIDNDVEAETPTKPAKKPHTENSAAKVNDAAEEGEDGNDAGPTKDADGGVTGVADLTSSPLFASLKEEFLE
jgi:hypothetical protein